MYFKYLLVKIVRVLNWLDWTVYPLAILSVIAFALSPIVINAVFVSIYSVIVFLKMKALLVAPSLISTVTIEATSTPLENVTSVLTQESGYFVGLSKTDQHGKFAFYVKPGNYSVSVISDTYYWTEQQIGSQYSVSLTTQQQQIPISVRKF